MPTIDFHELPNNTHSSWWRDSGMRRGMAQIVVLYFAIYSLGYDGSLLNGLQSINQWQKQFDHPAGTDLGLIAAMYYLPKIPATFVIAWMVDRFGRKIPLYLGALFMLAGALLGGLCHTRAQLMGSRVLLGIGTALAQVSAAALVPELSHPRIRHMAGGYLNCWYFVGSIFAAWLCFAMVFYPNPSTITWSWRIPTLVQGFGPVILAAGSWFVPESPRWLVKQGRVDEAHRILADYHANGERNDPLVLLEMREIETNVRLDQLNKQTSWLAFFETAGNRRRFFIIILVGTATQWIGNGIISYYLVPVLKLVGISKPAQTSGINGGLSIWSWFVAMLGASLTERFGRRKLFLTSLAGCLVSFIFMLGFSAGFAETHRKSIGTAIVPFLFFFNAFYALAFTPIPMLYIPEISPFSLRAKSAALLLLAQNCAQTFNQFANPVALAAIAWKYFAVYVAVIAAYLALFYFFVRETRGLTVEEAAAVYEDESVKQDIMEQERRLHEQGMFEETKVKEDAEHAELESKA